MRIILTALFLFIGAVASAQDEERPLARAMDAMRDGDWAGAQIEARADGQFAVDVILWHFLRKGMGTPEQVQDFLARNGDWPGLPYLREKSEETMVAAPDEAVLEFYAAQAPRTGSGALSYARALLAAGRTDQAHQTVIRAWTTLPLSATEFAAYLLDFGPVLEGHHWARLDNALWNGWEDNARAAMPLVTDGQRRLAEARLGLRLMADGVDGLIAAVPEALKSDAGLAYERFNWRVRKGRRSDAIALLLETSTSAKALGRPEAWAGFRRYAARDLMTDGNRTQAYKVASTHFLTEGDDYADLEWLSGYLSLRFMSKPDRAVTHFERFRESIASPISRGRAGYWLGRAHEARKDEAAAREAYAFGAEYQTSFYGLLAAERGGVPFDPILSGREVFPPWREAAFLQSSVYKAAILLLASGELSLSERFLTHLAESLDRTQIGQMGDMLAEFDQPHIQVMLGKRAAAYEMQLPGPYYALHPMAGQTWPVPTELVLAIARRESEFDPNVVSGAGARGLMQVMPGTAREVSERLGLDYAQSRLTADPAYNATLGAAYLAEVSERFGGNPVLVPAAYNAGPSRPERWIELYGDPRSKDVDVIDWIEFIPFQETRNYVMRVTESLPIYRARLGLDPLPVPFSQELKGSGLLPLAPEGE